MLNLSILDYPDHADPVKRLTEHVVNKVVSAGMSGLPFETRVGGKHTALFNIQGTYYAINDTCTHKGGPAIGRRGSRVAK